MKIINNIKYSLLTIIVVMIMSGCHKVNNSAPTALLELHMHTSIDSTQLNPSTPNVFLPDSLGRLEELTTAQFYLTNVSIRNSATQQWYTIPNSIIIKRIQNEQYIIGNVPAGTYDDIRFTVGLSNTLNSQAPSSYSSITGADTVLSTIEQNVMWGSGSTSLGYTFMYVKGYDSTDHVAFNYQLGGFGDTVQVTLPVQIFTLGANEPQIPQPIHIICDYGKLLQNINISASPSGSFYGPNQNAATAVWNNIIHMFRYECSTPNGNC